MLTSDQVTAIAPDAASFKAGKGLATPGKWQSLGGDEDVLWGLAKGSGKNPYQTQIELATLATKCSCPSRKFPCKHALGLMFIAAENSALLTESDRPDWVNDWLQKREQRQETSAKKKAAAADKPKDEAAAAKRRATRESRIDQGIVQLDQFIDDLIRRGLGAPECTDAQSWETLGRRLVDSQAPGLANFITRLGDQAGSGLGWETPFLHQLAKLRLLTKSYRQRDTLSPELRAEVEQLIGLPVEKEAVLASPPVDDQWFIASREIIERDRLVTCKTWLYGITSKRWALLLDFGSTQARPISPWPLGTTMENKLSFYPGAAPDRALPHNDAARHRMLPLPQPGTTFTDLLDQAAAILAANPWRERVPFLLAAQPVTHHDKRVLLDLNGDALPLDCSSSTFTELSSLCAGSPVLMAGEWNHQQLTVLAARDGDEWVTLNTVAP